MLRLRIEETVMKYKDRKKKGKKVTFIQVRNPFRVGRRSFFSFSLFLFCSLDDIFLLAGSGSDGIRTGI